jgi:hypothetical protein
MTTTSDTAAADWTIVDEGWGRKAVDFATLSEPANCREYVALHHRLGLTEGDKLLASFGFTEVERISIPFAWEFADPETYARALASTGPAYEAIQNVGETVFLDRALAQAREQVRDGLPLRAEIAVTGYLARKEVSR